MHITTGRYKIKNSSTFENMNNRILLVEDEKKMADSVAAGLTELEYEVEVAYDGTIGQHLFESKKFDLIILDINLPGKNGFELCRQIRKQDKGVPVLMLTAMNNIQDKITGFDAGADDYLAKPFEFRELLLRVGALIRRTTGMQAHTGNKLKVEDLELDVDSKEVTRAGIPVSLTAKEMQLLEFFMRNKNKVISRADIAEQVWGGYLDGKTNVIDVYVNFLRKKVDADFEKKLIHTKVGMGYIMKA